MKKSYFHYVACGLPNVWLENGFTEENGPTGKTFQIKQIEQLHLAIGLSLVNHETLLTGDEFRFLRTELNMSRKSLGEVMGYSTVTLKKWEAGENPIPKTADSYLRMLYSSAKNRNSPVGQLVDMLNRIEKINKERKLTFVENADGAWELDTAA